MSSLGDGPSSSQGKTGSTPKHRPNVEVSAEANLGNHDPGSNVGPSPKEVMMRFYNQPHRFYAGIDLHARTLFVCVLDQDGQNVPDPMCFDWHLAPWPSFAYVEESGRDRFAEAALGSSSRLTGTIFGWSPQTPRLATIRADAGFSGGVTMVTCRCHSRAAARHRSIDPANVFGAAAADADLIRKLAVAADGFDSPGRSSHTKRRSRILLSSGVRPLTREAINGFGVPLLAGDRCGYSHDTSSRLHPDSTVSSTSGSQ